MIDVDAEAESLYRIAGHDPHAPPGPVTLAISLLQREDAVLSVHPTEVWGNGEVSENRGRWQILVSNALWPTRFDFVVAHEISEWHLRDRHHLFQSIAAKERTCDAIAAALLVPRPAFRDALLEHGPAFDSLARDFATSETLVALRLGEVERIELAVVGPTVRRRGAGAVLPDDDASLRALADRPAPGIRRARFSDDPSRVALVAS